MTQDVTKGKLVVITGPSGVGKGTIVRYLISNHENIFLSISATTRQPREGEVNGKDYFFLSREEFKGMIEEGNFLEWAEYAGNYYGTPKKPILEQIEQGKIVILEIEVLGARQVKENFPSATRIFILPPSRSILEERLRGRGTDAEDVIIKRLQKAEEELAVSHEFDYQVVNDILPSAIEQIENLILA